MNFFCSAAADAAAAETVVDLPERPEGSRLIIIGDTHGQLQDVLWIFKESRTHFSIGSRPTPYTSHPALLPLQVRCGGIDASILAFHRADLHLPAHVLLQLQRLARVTRHRRHRRRARRFWVRATILKECARLGS